MTMPISIFYKVIPKRCKNAHLNKCKADKYTINKNNDKNNNKKKDMIT